VPRPPDPQEEQVSTGSPDRFFKPPTSARGVFAGWLGVFLDLSSPERVHWDEICTILVEAFRIVAPKSLVADLCARQQCSRLCREYHTRPATIRSIVNTSFWGSSWVRCVP
jgi:hypothetical protein